MAGIFEAISALLDSSRANALLGAFVWGILSMLLSPCHLTSIPLLVSFIHGQGRPDWKRGVGLAALFSAGVMITIGAIGLITSATGQILGDVGGWGTIVVSVVFVLTGLYLLDILKIPSSRQGRQPVLQRKGGLAAFIMGLIFGLAVGPCTFAFMAPVLGVCFKIAETDFYFSLFLILAYAAGHCLIIVLAGGFTGVVQKYLNWAEKSKSTVVFRKIMGVILIVSGIYIFFKG